MYLQCTKACLEVFRSAVVVVRLWVFTGEDQIVPQLGLYLKLKY